MTVHYKRLNHKIYKIADYTIQAVQPEHIEKIRLWRNEQMNVLRQSRTISKEEQIHYYQSQVWLEMDKNQPNKILLSIKANGELVGYGGLTNISWNDLRGEISFLLDTKIANTKKDYDELFPTFLMLIKKIAFCELKLYRIYGELFDLRPKYAKAYENKHFTLEGILKGHSRINNTPIDSFIYALLRTDQ